MDIFRAVLAESPVICGTVWVSQQLMGTRLPEKAVAQAQYTQKKAIPLSESETWDRGFPLMAGNEPGSLVQMPRQKESS